MQTLRQAQASDWLSGKRGPQQGERGGVAQVRDKKAGKLVPPRPALQHNQFLATRRCSNSLHLPCGIRTCQCLTETYRQRKTLGTDTAQGLQQYMTQR